VILLVGGTHNDDDDGVAQDVDHTSSNILTDMQLWFIASVSRPSLILDGQFTLVKTELPPTSIT